MIGQDSEMKHSLLRKYRVVLRSVNKLTLTQVSLLLSGLLLAGCGASYTSLYDNDLRFEHCYRLDSAPRVPQQARISCWSEWVRTYSRGQSRDRVEYALSRQRTLWAGDTRPVLYLDNGQKAPITGAHGMVDSPLPPTPFEAPPKERGGNHGHKSQGKALISNEKVQGKSLHQECVHDCGNQFTNCATACQDDSCIQHCASSTRVCIGQCLLAHSAVAIASHHEMDGALLFGLIWQGCLPLPNK
jgi:hypothetical protein